MSNETLTAGTPEALLYAAPTHASTGSTIVVDAGPGTGTTPAPPRVRPSVGRASGRSGETRLRFGGVVRSERMKLTSLRSVRITLLITLLSGITLSGLIALLFSSSIGQEPGALPPGAEGYETYLVLVSTFTAPFLALVFGVLGVFAISSEYSSGMILSTLAAVPKRTPVFVAKALVLAVVSALTAAVLVAAGLVLGVIFLPESATQLFSEGVISGGLGTIAYLALIALLAYGVAALTRSTAGGIAIVAGLTFVAPIGFQLLTLTNWEWVTTAAMYLPSNLGGALTNGIAGSNPGLLGYWAALAAMVVWAAAAVIPAGIAFARRDAK